MRDGGGFSTDAKAAALRRVRDVADFHSRWVEFRPVAQGALQGPALSPAEADVLAWMIEVMDRIAPRDLDFAAFDDIVP